MMRRMPSAGATRRGACSGTETYRIELPRHKGFYDLPGWCDRVSRTQRQSNSITISRISAIVDEITVVVPGINGKMAEVNAAMGLWN